MAIRAVSRQEFDRFGATRVTINGVTHKAIEWFADDTGVVIGAIAYDESALGWAFVILARDIYGNFRAFNLETGLGDLDDTRRRVRQKIAMAVASSTNVCPLPPAA
jgi:hypothetical protein